MDDVELRNKLIQLSELGVIKQKVKFLKECPAETLITIQKKYEADQLRETNEFITRKVMENASSLLCWVDLVKKKYEADLSNELEENTLLRKDVEKIVESISPYFPLLGLVTGGVSVGKFAVKSRLEGEEEHNKRSPPGAEHDPAREEGEQKE